MPQPHVSVGNPGIGIRRGVHPTDRAEDFDEIGSAQIIAQDEVDTVIETSPARIQESHLAHELKVARIIQR